MQTSEITTIVDRVKNDGYALIENVLSVQHCEMYKAMLDDDYTRYGSHYATVNTAASSLRNKMGEKVVYNMHNKKIAYFDLFDHPLVLQIIAPLLQLGSYMDAEAFNLLNISARCPIKGGEAQQLHLDSNLPGINDTPLIINVVWLIDEFRQDNGATRLVPGSHKFNSYAENGRVYPEEVVIEAPRGSVLIFNSSLWHGGTENTAGVDRWAVLLGYGRWFIKPSFDLAANTPEHIFDQLTDERKALLGFDSVPPLDEFSRVTRRSEGVFEAPGDYSLPDIK